MCGEDKKLYNDGINNLFIINIILIDIDKTIQILEALASGCSPTTGEILPDETVLNERDVIRALQLAIDELRKNIHTEEISSQPKKKRNKNGEAWKEIDFFRQKTFNYLTPDKIEKLKSDIEKLGIQKSENLNEQVINARIRYPRAYEEWSPLEKEILKDALQYTNDLSILSDCFQRGRGAIENYGKKIIYEEQDIK